MIAPLPASIPPVPWTKPDSYLGKGVRACCVRGIWQGGVPQGFQSLASAAQHVNAEAILASLGLAIGLAFPYLQIALLQIRGKPVERQRDLGCMVPLILATVLLVVLGGVGAAMQSSSHRPTPSPPLYLVMTLSASLLVFGPTAFSLPYAFAWAERRAERRSDGDRSTPKLEG